MTRKVLFVAYGGGHITMLLPVMRALRERTPEVDCRLLALTTGHARAVAAGERPMGYKDFLHLVDAPAALDWGRRLSEGNSSPDVSPEESLAYLGINYLDLVAQHGLAGAEQRYREQGRYGFYPLHFMRRLLDEMAPDAVVSTNSPRSEQAALDVAIERGIPSIGLVDLFGADDDTYLTRPGRPPWTCVLAESVRARLLARGFPSEGVVVTGNPAFDGLFALANQQAAQRFLQAQHWRGLRPILWAGHSEPQSHPATPVPAGQGLALEVEAILRDVVRRDPGLALVVRYHPSQWHTFSPEPAQERVHFSVPPREPIHPLVLASALVVVQNSTVGLEAAVAGKPVISIENAPSVHIGFSLARMGVSTGCPAPAQLAELVPEVLARPAPQPTGYASDGRAAERVASVVQRALEAGRGDIQSKSTDAFQ